MWSALWSPCSGDWNLMEPGLCGRGQVWTAKCTGEIQTHFGFISTQDSVNVAAAAGQSDMDVQMTAREEGFLLQPHWLRNKLQQIKHVIRLWRPVCCPCADQSCEFGSRPTKDREKKRERERKEPPPPSTTTTTTTSSSLYCHCKRWFVFRQRGCLEFLTWFAIFPFRCCAMRWVGSRRVSGDSCWLSAKPSTRREEITLPRSSSH